MSEPSRAVFLSYPSQDAEAARRIADALRAADIEVWFDQSALRGGDAWDASIRKHIKACALFIPVISANAHARVEGYFRLEWKLAVDRSHLIAPDQAFLLPVVIDGTPQTDERIPDRFRELQWTRLPAGETSPTFVERVSRLLSQTERTGSAEPDHSRGPQAVAQRPLAPTASQTVWARIKAHKVLEWTLAYAAGAYTLLHLVEMVGTAFDWPHIVARIATLLLALGVPIATTLAWYHGHRAQHRVSGPELTIITVLLVISGSVLWLLGRPSYERALPQSVSSAAEMTSGAPTTLPEKSIAVLPFVNMSSDKEQDYFSDGLTEEMIELLGQVPDLRVPARTSSFYFKGKNETIANMARQLKVAYVLEGSVRKAGKRLRITAQLIRADNGYHLWSQAYDRDDTDVFAVQDDIAKAVVSALQVKLAAGVEETGSRGTTNTEAYNEYLLGRELYRRGGLEALRHAVAAYSQAIALDANYAAAYVGLALAEALLADLTGDRSGIERAGHDVDKAIALAPNDANGYAQRSFIRDGWRWDWSGAQADIDKALTLDPRNSEVQHRYANLLDAQGRLPEAIAVVKKAIELDPLSSPTWNHLGLFYTEMGDYVSADAALGRAIELEPTSVIALNNLGNLRLLQGKSQEALAAFRKRDDEAYRLTGIAMAEHTLGHAKESQQALDELIAKHAQDSPDSIAEVFAWRGEKDRAFEWLERAYEQRDSDLSDIKVDPMLKSLRADPRYNALLRKMKVPG